MKVICINDRDLFGDDLPSVKKGNIYTVIEKFWEDAEEDENYIYPAGYYYVFIETGDDAFYHESCFIEINEDQQDETEFERNYNKQLT